jgi:hypothetical protein
VLFSLTTLNAHAALTSTDGGLGVYDSGINATWTSNANLLGTWEAAPNSSIISTIVTAEAAAINTAYGYSLSASDFGTGGQVDWYAAQAYVDYLNKIDYGNSTQWALPTTVDSNSSIGYPSPSSSQLAELFYSELGGTAGGSIPTNSLFTNEQTYAYWSGTEYASIPGGAWGFYTSYGYQNSFYKNVQFYAWAVSPGQVSAAVPEPSIAWMLLTGLVGLLGLKRRGHAGYLGALGHLALLGVKGAIAPLRFFGVMTVYEIKERYGALRTLAYLS